MSRRTPGLRRLFVVALIDARTTSIFRARFGNAPGVTINTRVPGTGSPLRPDLFFPDIEGSSVIFDVGGASKITGIEKYEGIADVLIPVVPAPR